MRGRHSEIRLENGIAVKKFHPQFKYNFWKELAILNSLQPYSFVPRLFGFNLQSFEIKMEFIEGEHIGDVIEDIGATDIEKILDICRTLDRLGIEKQEMNHPDRHIIIGKRIVFVDFERSVLKDKPSNLTQFIVYLNFKRKIIDRETFVRLMRYYKVNFDERSYGKVKEAILRKIA